MPAPYFFGYGSLVNRQTHSFSESRPARVSGWRRKWRHSILREVAYLTVVPAPGHAIDGLIAAVPDGDWKVLDQREHAYDRLRLEDDAVAHDHPDPIFVQMYKTRDGEDAAPTVRHPVLLSYLDTVITGYQDIFGETGVGHFFDTTDGWDAPILDDRKEPIYPRYVEPSPDQKLMIDDRLASLSAVVKKP